MHVTMVFEVLCVTLLTVTFQMEIPIGEIKYIICKYHHTCIQPILSYTHYVTPLKPGAWLLRSALLKYSKQNFSHSFSEKICIVFNMISPTLLNKNTNTHKNTQILFGIVWLSYCTSIHANIVALANTRQPPNTKLKFPMQSYNNCSSHTKTNNLPLGIKFSAHTKAGAA